MDTDSMDGNAMENWSKIGNMGLAMKCSCSIGVTLQHEKRPDQSDWLKRVLFLGCNASLYMVTEHQSSAQTVQTFTNQMKFVTNLEHSTTNISAGFYPSELEKADNRCSEDRLSLHTYRIRSKTYKIPSRNVLLCAAWPFINFL